MSQWNTNLGEYQVILGCAEGHFNCEGDIRRGDVYSLYANEYLYTVNRCEYHAEVLQYLNMDIFQ